MPWATWDKNTILQSLMLSSFIDVFLMRKETKTSSLKLRKSFDEATEVSFTGV